MIHLGHTFYVVKVYTKDFPCKIYIYIYVTFSKVFMDVYGQVTVLNV
jgi:hypothetical protein